MKTVEDADIFAQDIAQLIRYKRKTKTENTMEENRRHKLERENPAGQCMLGLMLHSKNSKKLVLLIS